MQGRQKSKVDEVVNKDRKVTGAEAEVQRKFQRCNKCILDHGSVASLFWWTHICHLFTCFAGITKQLFPNTDDALIRRMMGQKLNNCTKKPILSKDLNSGAFQKHGFW